MGLQQDWRIRWHCGRHDLRRASSAILEFCQHQHQSQSLLVPNSRYRTSFNTPLIKMKTINVALTFALATVATAQLDNIPQCALPCLLTALSSDGCPSLTDFKCHCEKASTLFATALPCVQRSCPAAQQAETIAAVEGACKAAGVPVQVPNVSGGASSAAPASSTPAAVSSAASAASSAASAASSALSALSSAQSAASSAASAATSAPVTTGTPSRSGTAPASASGSPTPTVSQFTGAAAQATQAVGILGAAALAIFAL